MKHSIRAQLILIFVVVMTVSLLLIALINHFFLGTFYTRDKTGKLQETYEKMNTLASSGSSDFSSEIMKVSVQDNIQVLVTDSDFQNFNSTSRDAQSLASRLFGYYTGFYRDTCTVVEKTDKYTLQETSDKMISTQYLEMWGQLDNGDWFLLRTPLESITNAAHLSNIFFIIVGLLVTVAAVVVISFLARRFTKPIVQLTEISQKMTNLDFDAKYSGKANNEIDRLGENFNKMSHELEGTISELKSANVELQKDVEHKTQIDEVRKEFLNNVSHELKTPIALIQGYAEGLKENIASDEESRDFYCDVIIDESAKMNNMVKKLLTLNQLEFGNDQVAMDRFDIVQLIKGVIAGMKIIIEDKGADVSFNENDPVFVWGDEFKIEEVVTNYMSNALNHLDYDKKIDVRLTQQNGIVTTSVFNTGDPIPEEDLPKVWDKFYKVDKARTREYGGSGIGLSIVKAIIDGHHQKCGVRNYENGVAFWFTLEGKPTVDVPQLQGEQMTDEPKLQETQMTDEPKLQGTQMTDEPKLQGTQMTDEPKLQDRQEEDQEEHQEENKEEHQEENLTGSEELENDRDPAGSEE